MIVMVKEHKETLHGMASQLESEGVAGHVCEWDALITLTGSAS